MTQPNILELAKQGDAKAIALLLNRQLQPKGITATAALKDGCLQVILEAVEVPSQQVLAAYMSKSIAGLGAASIEKVKVYGRQTGTKVPAWNQEFEMAGQKLPVADVSETRSAISTEVTESKPLSLKERAKLGDVEAIASLLNIPLRNKGISATASLQDGCLQVMLEGDPVPEEELAVRVVRRELTSLKAGAIASVKVYGQQVGEDFPAWNREFEIVAQTQTVKQNNNVKLNNHNHTLGDSIESDGLQEIAKNGDLNAIAILIQKSLAAYEVHVDAEIQYGVMLWLKLKSDKTLDSQACLNRVSRILNNIQPDKIVSARISQINSKNPKQQAWNKYLAFKEGQFIDNTKAVNQMTGAFCAAVVIVLIFISVMYKPTSTTSSSPASSSSTPASSSTSNSTTPRTFLGKSQTGYELWADKNCVYVKGMTEGDLARLNTDVWRFKDEVKLQTGYKCVLFE
ncbi:hypothetical protein [Microcoleus sp. Pol12B5]|uniref:hypothetical protein n=1 Tax=Microcoleus sp. Pol12B5 TaxID=3055396 RepID=UPI002FD2C8B5